MRQLFLDKGALVVKDVCQPLLDDYTALIQVEYSFISSGTERATINNAQQNPLFHNIPRKIKKIVESVAAHGVEGTKALISAKIKSNVQPLGYSCSGRVIAVGKKVQHVRPGDMVACAGAGYANHADLVAVPSNLLARITAAEHLSSASITTIGSIALQGIRRAELALGESVCVIGLGLIGQITVQLAKLSGCTVVGIDVNPERLKLASSLGADWVGLADSATIANDIAYMTQHCGVDATIITAASKSDAIIAQAMELTRKKGRVVIVGDVGLHIQRSPMYEKEIDVRMSCSYGPGRYDANYEQYGNDYPYAYVRWTEQRNMRAFVQLIEQKKIQITPLISHQASIDEIEQAYNALNTSAGLGAIITYPQKTTEQTALDITQITAYKAPAKNIRVAFIGAGGFAKIKLMPIISSMSNVNIGAIVDANMSASINAARTYAPARALTHDDELFNEDIADVVVIASPHKYHCEQAIRALSHGKAVFMEKPMVTSFEQLEQFNNALDTYSTTPFCVDYNRSFAPFITKIKTALENRHSPLVAHYRMNAGYIPKDHWVQTDIGAGRIIGEACHIFDLFCYLTDAEPVSVSVESISSSDKNLFPTDNFSVQISFSDGSICTLLYTSLGSKELAKERLELFFDSKAIIMDDYEKLIGYGFSKIFNEVTTRPDKGHAALIKNFFDAIRAPQYTAPISHSRLKQVARLTLIIDQLACEGGGNSVITS